MARWLAALVEARFIRAPAACSAAPPPCQSRSWCERLDALGRGAPVKPCHRPPRPPHTRAHEPQPSPPTSPMPPQPTPFGTPAGITRHGGTHTPFGTPAGITHTARRTCSSKGTSASMPAAAAMARLLSGCAARFISAPAASSCTPGVPLVSSATSGRMAPASSMACMFAGCWQARFHRAKQACSLAGAGPLLRSATRCGSAPAAATARWFTGHWMTRLPRIPAAAS
eukprot:scaffold20962_cov112-Isochrysis_galbana.AAC.2